MRPNLLSYQAQFCVASTRNGLGRGKVSSPIVTCLSCHRAHGSPYADLLRWDYDTMIAGNAGDATGKGCFVCHTTKD